MPLRLEMKSEREKGNPESKKIGSRGKNQKSIGRANEKGNMTKR